MKRPNIRGLKTKAIRVDPAGLAEFREELKADPDWAMYAGVSESELVTLAVVFSRIYIRPEVITMTVSDYNHLIDEAVRINIAEVALALGGVAQMGPNKTISVTRPGADSIESFPTKVVEARPKPILQ